MMKKIFCSFLFINLFIMPIVYAHLPVQALNGLKTPSLAPMLAKITPAVVNIAIEKTIPKYKSTSLENLRDLLNGRPAYIAAVGSGVIFDAKKGLIVTNAHVVAGEHLMIVTLKDGRRYRATLVTKNDGFDIAIIKIPAHHLTRVSFGDSDRLKVGDFVAAIGSPFGLTQSVTSGVISALNRVEPQIEGFQSFIQTDAPINPGNSGGALVDMQGHLIGINTAILAPAYGNIGIGFAIPSNMVHSVIEQLLKYGKVEQGVLGVVVQNITPELAGSLGLQHDKGVLVTQIIPGSPADKAGIQTKDIVLTVNNKPIENASQIHNILGLMRPGTPITINILREQKPMTLSAVVGNPKTMQKQRALPFLMGMRLQDFSELESDGQVLKGAIVIDVSDTSPGALAGLQIGDVITNANSQDINSVKQLEDIALHQTKPLLVKVARGNSSLFLVIQPT